MNRAFQLRAAFAAPVAFACAAAATPAQANDYIQFSIGADYSSGDYGTTPDTEIVAVPVGVKLQQGDFFLRASLPWLHVNGPAIPGDGGALPGPGVANSRSGIGDLSVAAGYSLPVTDTFYFDMIGKVKLPTASESKGLGTGTTDFTAEVELTKVLGDTSISLRGGRRFNGSSAAFPLQDVWQAGGGIYHTAGKLMLGLDYDWRDAALPTVANRSELTGSLGYKLTDAFRLQGYAYTGLSDGSPNIGGGLQLVYRIGE